MSVVGSVLRRIVLEDCVVEVCRKRYCSKKHWEKVLGGNGTEKCCGKVLQRRFGKEYEKKNICCNIGRTRSRNVVSILVNLMLDNPILFPIFDYSEQQERIKEKNIDMHSSFVVAFFSHTCEYSGSWFLCFFFFGSVYILR